uniref:Putative DJ-1/PfpI family protein n=1 Tax=uncultured marine microorganism HF4000_007I05 TaxID=455511 RepID=B3T0X6_9ZZZZ|nr:putative DJ-1/PfpI family protein [uncultured marine microorganism HF4000_007I05]
MFSSIIISGALAQDHEFIYPFYRLLEAESKLDVCLIGGKSVQGILGTNLPPTKDYPVKDINQVKVNDYDLLVLPGGVKALEKTRQDKRFIKFIADFHKADKVIACICSGVQLLISAKIIKGKKIAGYYSLEDDIVNAGGIYTDQPAVVDSKIVTTAHYKHMGPWMRAALNFFNEK